MYQSLKLDRSPGINLGTGRDNGRNIPVDHAKSSLLTAGDFVPKLGELSHRLVKQLPDIVCKVLIGKSDHCTDLVEMKFHLHIENNFHRVVWHRSGNSRLGIHEALWAINSRI
eukprot:g19917.t1